MQADPDAGTEFDKALSLQPDLENGRKLYLTCAVCHGPEGWGSPDGYYPQIAGQIDSVIIKQLADIRSRNRDNPTMYPFSKPSRSGWAPGNRRCNRLHRESADDTPEFSGTRPGP